MTFLLDRLEEEPGEFRKVKRVVVGGADCVERVLTLEFASVMDWSTEEAVRRRCLEGVSLSQVDLDGIFDDV